MALPLPSPNPSRLLLKYSFLHYQHEIFSLIDEKVSCVASNEIIKNLLNLHIFTLQLRTLSHEWQMMSWASWWCIYIFSYRKDVVSLSNGVFAHVIFIWEEVCWSFNTHHPIFEKGAIYGPLSWNRLEWGSQSLCKGWRELAFCLL